MRRTILGKTLSLLLLGALVPGLLPGQGQEPRTHTVRKGDTLWDLAKAYFGDPFLWPEIYRLNTQVVEDPHWIYPGEVLRLAGGPDVAAVPSTDTPVDSAAADGVPADSAVVPPAEPAGDAVALAPEPEPEEQGGPLFGPPPLDRSGAAELRAYREQSYRLLRRSEFYSSGFLTEGDTLPFGKLLGSVTPQYIGTALRNRPTVFGKVAVVPPADAAYQVGDTLLFVRIDRTIRGYGEVVVPTGMGRVIDAGGPETLVMVIAEYGPIRGGQLVLPAEKFLDPGHVRPLPVADGVEGRLIQGREPRTFKSPQDVVFIDKGRRDGVARGDIFEIWRAPQSGEGRVASTIAEVIARVQVVHVRERTATARVLTVTAPDLPPGSRVRQVAKLPS
ncbi:MAG TPA: LysM peptidoglycan-binding domain-containing protein [Gemmatimonadales bacterium]|nr:LysM peptidoglycan-binding domain-containing protein [Gemmatimonadales bacterium]